MASYENANNGILVAKTDCWNYFVNNGIVWSVPADGCEGSTSFWCAVKELRAHFYRLRQIKANYSSLIPPQWEIINNDFFIALGIY